MQSRQLQRSCSPGIPSVLPDTYVCLCHIAMTAIDRGSNSSDSDLDECSSPACHELHAPNSTQCLQHTSIPRCQHQEPCDEAELSGTQYCNTHRCQKPSCRNQAVSPNGKCEFHFSCEKDGCGNTRAEKTEGEYEKYCYQRKEFRTSLNCKS